MDSAWSLESTGKRQAIQEVTQNGFLREVLYQIYTAWHQMIYIQETSDMFLSTERS